MTLTEKIKEVLEMDSRILELAKELHTEKSLLVMGRGYNYATCLEGALVGYIYFCEYKLPNVIFRVR